jgi:hypothetical protein
MRGKKMKKKTVLSIIVLVALAMIAQAAQAICPESKSEVLVVTPSGTEKTLCIPALAINGIENAAQNSVGAIFAGIQCPCWSPAELEEIAATDPGFYCSVSKGEKQCWLDDGNGYADLSLVMNGKGAECENSLTGNKITGLNYATYDECVLLISAYDADYTPLN